MSSPPEAENLPEAFVPQRLLHLNVGLCRPKTWKPFLEMPKQLGDMEFLGRGFASPELRPAAFVFSFYAPRSFRGLKENPAVKWAREILSQKPFNLPASSGFAL